MTSLTEKNGKSSNRNLKHNVDSSSQRPKFCQNLFYFLPCFKKKGSPASSATSSKTSKHNFFLENHYIIKCPKKGDKHKEEGKGNKVVGRSANPSDNAPLTAEARHSTQKEVRFLGAAKRHSERNDYVKILGMEPNEYLNQFSSVFIKNLKNPVPKDPSSLPKKYNVYVPPKRRSKRNSGSESQSSAKNVLPRGRRSVPVHKTISSVVKEKYAAFQKNFDVFNKKTVDSKLAFHPVSDEITTSDQLEAKINKRYRHRYGVETEIGSPWQCHSGKIPTDVNESRGGYSKGNIEETGSSRRNIKLSEDEETESHVQRFKRYLHMNPVRETKTKHIIPSKKGLLSDRKGYKPNIEMSLSDESECGQPSDRNPWPKQNFLQLHTEQGLDSKFRQLADYNYKPVPPVMNTQAGKVLIWKLLIKNQKEYI